MQAPLRTASKPLIKNIFLEMPHDFIYFILFILSLMLTITEQIPFTNEKITIKC